MDVEWPDSCQCDLIVSNGIKIRAAVRLFQSVRMLTDGRTELHNRRS